MNRKILLLTIIILVVFTAEANEIKDQLFSDACKVLRSDPSRALELMSEYKRMSTGDYSEIGKSNWMIGFIYSTSRHRELALINYFNAISAYQAVSSNTADVGKIYLDIGVIYLRAGSYEYALRYFRKSLHILGDRDADLFKARNYHNMGVCMRETNNLDSAAYFLQQSLMLRQGMELWSDVSSDFNEIASVAFKAGKYDQALRYYSKSLDLLDETNDVELHSFLLNNMGECYLRLGEIERAYEYFTAALKVKRANGIAFWYGSTLNNLATIYELRGEYDEAIGLRMDVVKSEYVNDAQLEDAYRSLISLYEAAGTIDSAFYYAKLLTNLKVDQDSMTEVLERQAEQFDLEQIAIQYDYAEAERAKDKQLKWILIFSVIFTGGIGMAVFGWVQSVKRKSKNQGRLLSKVNDEARFCVELLIYENEQNKATIAEYKKVNASLSRGFTVSKRTIH